MASRKRSQENGRGTFKSCPRRSKLESLESYILKQLIRGSTSRSTFIIITALTVISISKNISARESENKIGHALEITPENGLHVPFRCLCHSAAIKNTTVDVRLAICMPQCLTARVHYCGVELIIRAHAAPLSEPDPLLVLSFFLSRSARSLVRSPPRWKFLSSRTARPCFSLWLLINPRLNPIHPASSRQILLARALPYFVSSTTRKHSTHSNNRINEKLVMIKSI